MEFHSFEQKKPAQCQGTERAKDSTAKQGCTTKTNGIGTVLAHRQSYGGNLGRFERLELHWEGFRHAMEQ
jgi:hypothetical protein